MRAIIPVAGSGVRLRPITEHKPKVMIEVAGKPVLGHILDSLARNGVDELVLVVGYMRENIEKWARESYGSTFKLHFTIQDEPLGLGHAVYCAKDFLDEDEVLVCLGDEIFSREYSEMLSDNALAGDIDASMGTMLTDNPSHYGMLRLASSGFVDLMVEKPSEWDGNLALAGAYYFKRGVDVRTALEKITSVDSGGKEYQLTSALQLMVENGARMTSFSVGKGYDCGRPESILASNRLLLEKNHFVDETAVVMKSEVVEPCHIVAGAIVRNSRVGPHVSIGAGSLIDDCTLSEAIVEADVVLKGVNASRGIFSKQARIILE